MHNYIFENLSSYTQSKNNFDINSIKVLTKNHGLGEQNVISPDNMFSVDVILKHMEELLAKTEKSIENSKELLDELVEISDDVNMDPCDFCVKLQDTNTIRSIHPKYLVERLDKVPRIIDGIIQNKMSKYDLESYLRDTNAVTALKKNLVRTSIPFDNDLEELPTNSSAEYGYDVDRMFVINIAIPFLKELQEKKISFRKAFTELQETADELKTKFSTYSEIIKGMNSKGNISSDTLNLVNRFMYNEIRTMHQCFYYMCHMFLVEITSCEKNIDALKAIVSRINEHELEDRAYSMSESVLNGTMLDMTAEDIAFPMIEGDVSPMISVLRKLVNTHYSGYIMNSNNMDKYIDVNLASASYDNTVYDDTESIFNAISISLDSLEKNIKDVYMSFDDVIEKCGFSEKLEDRFAPMLVKIKNISPYTSMKNHYSDDKIFLFIMKELTEAEDVRWNELGDSICTIYRAIKDLRDKLGNNMNDEFPNKEMNQEMIQYLFSLESSIKDLVGDIGCRYLQRYSDLSKFIETTYSRTGDLITVDVNECVEDDSYDTTDYMEYAQLFALEAMNLVNSYAIYESNRVYNETIMRTKYGFLMEAEPAQTPQPTQTQQTQPTTTAQPAQSSNTVEVQQDPSKMNENDVNKNNDAAAQTDTGNSEKPDEEKKKTFREKIRELLQKCQKFFGGALEKFAKALDLKKAINVKFLENNKDAILNRSFNGVLLKVPPYDTYDPQNIFTDIGTLNTNITGLKASDLASLTDETAIYSKLLPSVTLNGQSYSDYLPAHYRFGKDHPKDEKGKFQTVEYKNTALKTLAEKMVAFCEEYNNSGADNLKSEISKVKTTMENKLNSFTSNTDDTVSTEAISAIGQVSTAVQSITATMLNAYRDRYNDYMKALKGLVPKRMKTADTEDTGTGETPDENQPAEPTQDTNGQEQQPAATPA